jgi:hypothetical protein
MWDESIIARDTRPRSSKTPKGIEKYLLLHVYSDSLSHWEKVGVRA